MNQFNDVLISYIRSLLKEQYIRTSGKTNAKSTKILLTRIYEDDIEFEIECLKRYQEIIQHYHEQLEGISTLESDMELLNNPPEGLSISFNQRMAVTFRAENKRIVRSHLELIRFVLNVVQESFQLKSMKSLNVDPTEINNVYKRIYLQPMASELEHIKDGQFTSKKEEELFYFRRLCLRDYIHQVYNI